MALTPLERRFVLEYVKDPTNATKAAIRAGYSKKTARQIASENLSKPHIADEISTRLAAREHKAEVDAQFVLRELRAMAEVDINDAVDPETGKFLPLHEMPADVRRMIASIENEELFDWIGEGEDRQRVQVGTVRKMKFASKEKALEMLGRHLKMFVDRFEVKTDDTFAELLKKARERAQRK